jgi:hypothetical protein
MMTIRREQLRALEIDRRRDFEQRITAHITRFFPGLVSRMVRQASYKASASFKGERDVFKYIDLMCVFGPNFKTDSRYDWAMEILARSEI